VDKTWVVDDVGDPRFPVWSRGNVGEVFPEVVNPLTWVLGREADLGWRDAFVEFGALAPDDFDPDRRSLVGVFGGYCYLNVSCVRLFAHRTPGVKVADIDTSLFGEHEAPPWAKPSGARRLGRSALAARSLLRTINAKRVPGPAQDAAAVDAWIAALPPAAERSDAELIEMARTFGPRFRQLFCRHILISFQTSVALALLAQLAERATGDTDIVTSLVAGIGDIESAAPSAALWKLGRMRPDDPAFDAQLADFLTRFGYRGPNEWDFAAITWDANPEGALAQIEALRRADADHDPVAQRARLESERVDAMARVRAALPLPLRAQLTMAQRAGCLFAQNREMSKSTTIRAIHAVRVAMRELARRGRERGGPDDLQQFFLLTIDEVPDYLAAPGGFTSTLATRAATREKLMALVPPFVFDTEQPPPSTWQPRDAGLATAEAGTTLAGIGACPGVARGRARVVLDPYDPRGLGPGDVLIAPITDPSWTPLFLPAEAVVVDVGALLSHAVIVSRELGIPAVVSVTGATTTIPDGALVEVDGSAGTVKILEP
jgi:pyruvate,water dikinase